MEQNAESPSQRLHTRPKPSTEFRDVFIEPPRGSDQFVGLDLTHSRFVNVGAKNQSFENCDFSYSVFDESYFHQATFVRCKFIGCRFRDTNLRQATFDDCKFDYATFANTQLSANQIIGNFPSWPNTKRTLLRSLQTNFAQIGDHESAETILRIEFESTGEHLQKAARRDEGYYQKKYSSRAARREIWWRRLKHRFSSTLWGHGENPFRLLFWAALLVTMASFACCFLAEDIFQQHVPESIGETLLYSLHYAAMTFLGGSVGDAVPHGAAARTVTVVVAGAGYLTLGLIVASIYRRLASHR